ncbi:MAG: TAXI family TRAP transporter solute-binding subunit [Alphaproteobacteria bacterium]
MFISSARAAWPAAMVLFLAVADAEPARAQDHDDVRERVNQGQVGIMCGRTTGSYLYYCEDMAVAMNDNIGYSLRVVPMIGEGSVRNVEDVLYLRGVDLALAYADTLEFMKNQGIHPDIKERIAYITAMHGAELHIIARDDVASIDDLAGKKVNFSTPGTGTFLTMTNVFDALDLNVDVQSDAEAVALDRLKRGEIAAMALNAGTPWKLASEVAEADGLKLLDVPAERIDGPYEPVSWTSDVYPNLIDQGSTVETIRTRVILLAYNWPKDNPRCAKVDRFVDALRVKLGELKYGPYQEKWREVDLQDDVKGLTRWSGGCH